MPALVFFGPRYDLNQKPSVTQDLGHCVWYDCHKVVAESEAFLLK